MDGFGMGLWLLVSFSLLLMLLIPIHSLMFENNYKTLFFIVPITIIYGLYTYVIFTGTHNPGCVTWHAVGSNARLVGDRSYYGGRWRNDEHWEHDISYVPEECDCVTYHWPWGDENNFTEDSIIKGQFKGPSVKPDKLLIQEDEDDEEEDNDFEDEFFQDGVQIKTIINVE